MWQQPVQIFVINIGMRFTYIRLEMYSSAKGHMTLEFWNQMTCDEHKH